MPRSFSSEEMFVKLSLETPCFCSRMHLDNNIYCRTYAFSEKLNCLYAKATQQFDNSAILKAWILKIDIRGTTETVIKSNDKPLDYSKTN